MEVRNFAKFVAASMVFVLSAIFAGTIIRQKFVTNLSKEAGTTTPHVSMVHESMHSMGPTYASAEAVAMISAMDSGFFEKEFDIFVEKFEKLYTSLEERASRFEMFKTNLKYISEHNQKGLTYQLAVNHFADFSLHEFAEKFLGLFRRSKVNEGNDELFVNDELKHAKLHDLPDEVDWRKKGCVSEVKDQKSCGSCWAFSATGAIEGAWCAAGKGNVDLSEQQLVDCAAKEGNAGCQGGIMSKGMQYVIDNDGICAETDYPYIARRHWLKGCQAKHCHSVAKIVGYEAVPEKNEAALAAALAKYGPISIGIQANIRDFMLYHGGVFNVKCGEELDHGVLLVGYGEDSKLGKYWTIKNSWGPKWGEGGYIRMARLNSPDGDSGECGMALLPVYALVEGGPGYADGHTKKEVPKPSHEDDDKGGKGNEADEDNMFPPISDNGFDGVGPSEAAELGEEKFLSAELK